MHFDYKETDSQNNSSCTRGCSITDSLHSTNKLARAPLPWAIIIMSSGIMLEGSHQTIYVHITCADIVVHENVQQLYFQNTKYCCTRADFKTTHREHLEDCKISQLVMIDCQSFAVVCNILVMQCSCWQLIAWQILNNDISFCISPHTRNCILPTQSPTWKSQYINNQYLSNGSRTLPSCEKTRFFSCNHQSP